MENVRIKLDYQIEFILNEHEAKALDALAGYGIDSFLKVFYDRMGRHYLQPHEIGLISLFNKIKSLREPIAQIDHLNKEIRAIKLKP